MADLVLPRITLGPQRARMGSAEEQSERSPCGRGMADSRGPRRSVCTAMWPASLGLVRMPTGPGGDRSRR